MGRGGFVAVGVCVALLSLGVPGASAVDVEDADTCVLGPFAACAGADLQGADLRGAELRGSNFVSANLDRADAGGADLSDADLLMASLHGTRLDGADLTDAALTNAELLGASARRVHAPGLKASWASLADTDFTGADLTDAYLGASTAQRADLTDANLSGANLSNVDLYGARLTGTNLTGATLRGASLRNATLDTTTTLTGADLSGATWTDGTECAEGSIGTCTPDTTTTSSVELPGGGGSAAISFLKLAFAVGDVVKTCRTNVPKTGRCFDKGEPDLYSLSRDIAEFRAELAANQAALQDSMNAIMKSISEASMLRMFNAVRKDLSNGQLAVLKFQEYSACLALFNDPALKDAPVRTCYLTDMDGRNPSPHSMRVVDDLYAGTAGPLSDSLALGGPAARLYFATLWQFGGKLANPEPSKLGEAGKDLMDKIAGSVRQSGKDGLLYSTVEWTNAGLTAAQGGRTGSTPRFFPGTALVEFNRWASYYIEGQRAVLGALIGALQTRATQPQTQPDVAADMEAEATRLKSLLDNGTGEAKHGSTDVLKATYTIPLASYDVDPDNTTPLTVPSNRPEKVGFVTGSDGKVYRVQQRYGPTARPTAYAGFSFPTYGDLALLQEAWTSSGTTVSALQRAYPDMLPGGQRAAWWAIGGRNYRRIEIGNPYNENAKKQVPWELFSVPSDTPASGAFPGDSTYTTYDNSCIVPVRMWDGRPSASQSLESDRARSIDRGDVSGTQVFIVRKHGSKSDSIKANYQVSIGSGNYTTTVTTGAVPAFDLDMGGLSASKGYRLIGTGVLWRCNGQHTGYASDVDANWVSVTPMEAKGLFRLLSPKKVAFESCDDLREADWRGIGLPTAHDALAPGEEKVGLRDNQHRWDAGWYRANRALDTDRDGIACEPSQSAG